MTGEIEAAGDVVTGGLVARAIEPDTGVSDMRGGVCLNCATALAGAYCHRCGQPEHIHRSLAALWHDLAHGVLHFEGKAWRTLPLLAWRPGELTRRYVEGERARFVSPLALFLFGVFLMFAVISAVGGDLAEPDFDANARAQVTAELAKGYAAIEQTERERAAAITSGQPTTRADARRARQIEALRVFEKDAENLIGDSGPTFTDLRTGWAPLDRGIDKANANPTLMLYKIQTNAYKFSWALIPISVPFLWLIFAWRRQYRIYDHAIFVTYSLAFMTLLAVALTVAGMAGVSSGAIALAALLIPPVHVYRQLRGAYRLGRLNALARAVALLFFCSFALTAFIMLLLTLGLLG